MKGTTHPMRFTKAAAVAGAALMIGGLGSSASAAGNLSKTTILPAGESVTVTLSGQIPGTYSFIQQCWKNDTSPTFNQLTDCSQATGDQVLPDASGNATKSFFLFGGDEPNDAGWGCGPNTSAGLQKATTCYVRIAKGSPATTAGQEFFAFTYGVTPPPDVPEVPLNILLPLGAAAVLGGGALVRNRSRRAAA